MGEYQLPCCSHPLDATTGSTEMTPFETDIDRANQRIEELEASLELAEYNLNQCEGHVENLNLELTAEKDRSAQWANVAKAVGRRCYFRYSGMCAGNCPGRSICNCDGLTVLQGDDMPERWREDFMSDNDALAALSPKGGEGE